MTEPEPFVKYIERIVELSAEELTEFTAAFKLKNIKRNSLSSSRILLRNIGVMLSMELCAPM